MVRKLKLIGYIGFGQKTDNINRPRPVVAHFHDYADREDILTKAREKQGRHKHKGQRTVPRRSKRKTKTFISSTKNDIPTRTYKQR